MVSHAIAPTTYGGRESKFGFVAVFRTENELGIVENISVDCKGDSSGMGALYLCLGSTFLCLGTVWLNKDKDKKDKEDK